MKFSVQPVSGLSGNPMNTVVVDLENPTSTDRVTIALGTHTDITLVGTKTVAAVNGIAIFSGLQLNSGNTGYTLVATAPLQRNGVANFSPFGAFQPGYYYNFPPCGTSVSENTVTGNYAHGNIPVTPATMSVTSNPFNMTT